MDKKLFDSLVRSMEEMVAIEKGEFTPPIENVHRHTIPTSDTSSVRKDVEDEK